MKKQFSELTTAEICSAGESHGQLGSSLFAISFCIASAVCGEMGLELWF